MATHATILAWRIPWTEEHGGLQSLESQRVGPDKMTEHTQARPTYSTGNTVSVLY